MRDRNQNIYAEEKSSGIGKLIYVLLFIAAPFSFHHFYLADKIDIPFLGGKSEQTNVRDTSWVPELYYQIQSDPNPDVVFQNHSYHYPLEGSGVKELYEKLIEMAERGHPEAQYELGQAYNRGHEFFKHDQQKAIELFLAAAKQGHDRAMEDLGYAYATASGVKRNHVEAAKWYLVRKEFAPQEEYGMFERIRKKLSVEQLASANRKAEQWIKEEYQPNDDPRNALADYPSSFIPKNTCEFTMGTGHSCGSHPQIKIDEWSRAGGYHAYLLQVDLSPETEMSQVRVELSFNNDHNWLLNIGNSQTANGRDYNEGAKEGDSELQVIGRALSVFGDNLTHPKETLDDSKLIFHEDEFVALGKRAIFVIRDNHLYWESTHLKKCGYIDSRSIFELGEDSILHIGLHRTIKNLDRTGLGIKWARITTQPIDESQPDKNCLKH